MIITKTVDIYINNKNKKHFLEKGYIIESINSNIVVDVNDLSYGSKALIIAECEVCSKHKQIEYRLYLKSKNNKDTFCCSNSCSYFKNKIVIKEKYGTEHYLSTQDFKNKSKKTCISKYNSEYYINSEDYKIKTKQTCIDKYLVEYVFQSEQIKEKSKITLLYRYRVDNYTKCDDYIKKVEKTSLLKYNTTHPLKSSLIRDKIKSSLIKNHGEDITHNSKIESRNDVYKNRYDVLLGTDYKVISIGSDIEIYHKCCNEIFKTYSQLLYYRRKYDKEICTICNLIDNTSSYIEKQFIEYIKSLYPIELDSIENTMDVLGNYEIDLFLPDMCLGFEFNGTYWHSTKHKTNNYHYIKTNRCLDKNIQLIHVYEYDWIDPIRNKIIKSIINNVLCIVDIIYCTECIIKETHIDIINDFIYHNSLDTRTCSSIDSICLYKDYELVLVIYIESNMLNFVIKNNIHIVGLSSSDIINEFIQNNISDLYYKNNRCFNSEYNKNIIESFGFVYLEEIEPGPEIYIESDDLIVYNSGYDLYLYSCI